MRAFRHRDFRIFFFGALASNTGNWLQNLAVPFVIYDLTDSELWVGLAGFAQFMPSFLMSPLGGSLADRYSRKKVLLGSQLAMAVVAFVMWAVWILGFHEPLLILGITALTGLCSGLMIPSWQAFVPSLVPKEDLASAITLNSTQFNASRAIGPAMAGALIGAGGPGWAFFLNGVSFVAVIVALSLVRSPDVAKETTAPVSVVAGFVDAVGYIRQRTGILVGIVCAILVAFFGNPITQFIVVFTEDVYKTGPGVLGILAAGAGTGAVMIAPALSTWDGRIRRASVVRIGLPVYALAVIGFGLSPNWPLGLVALLVSGAGFLAVIATTNTAIQMIVAESMRGRVMSARVMGFMLSFPLGSLAQGALANQFGVRTAVTGSGVVLLSAALFLASKPALLATLDAPTDAIDRV